jgi:hypothetical protein
LTSNSKLAEAEPSILINNLPNPENFALTLKDKKTDIQSTNKLCEKVESKFVRDMMMLGDLGSEVESLKRHAI